MTELTDEEAKALLAECDNPDCLTCEYARALLDARAELTRLRADAAAMDDAVAHYPHPGYGKPYPITTVLRDLASQEGCDGEPYDAMMFAAKTIDDMRAAGHGTSVWAGSARMASLLIRGGEGDA